MIHLSPRRHASAARRALAGLVGLAVLLVGCRTAALDAPPPVATRTPTPPPPADPQSALAEFYDWYLTYPGDPLARHAYRSNENLRPYLTESFVKKIDAAVELAGEQGAAYDPVVCGQDMPTSLDYQVLVSEDTSASVLVQRYFYGTVAANNMIVDLTRSSGHWQIEDVSCSGGVTGSGGGADERPVPTPSGVELVYGAWEPFTSVTYGFSLRHPAAWHAAEVPTNSSYPGDPVAGYVDFVTGAGTEAPVGLVVSDAPLDGWRSLFPEPDAAVTLTFGSNVVWVEPQGYGETYYVIPHPQDGARRVALRVIEGSSVPPEALAEIVTTMLRSFQFDDSQQGGGPDG